MFSWIIFSFALLLLPTIYADSYDPGRLTPVTLVDTLDQPMELAVSQDGRIFFIELNGQFRVFDPKEGSVSLIQKFAVARRGKLG